MTEMQRCPWCDKDWPGSELRVRETPDVVQLIDPADHVLSTTAKSDRQRIKMMKELTDG